MEGSPPQPPESERASGWVHRWGGGGKDQAEGAGPDPERRAWREERVGPGQGTPGRRGERASETGEDTGPQ